MSVSIEKLKELGGVQVNSKVVDIYGNARGDKFYVYSTQINSASLVSEIAVYPEYGEPQRIQLINAEIIELPYRTIMFSDRYRNGYFLFSPLIGAAIDHRA